MKPLSLNHTAAMIGVSVATIRNWTKAGHIQPCNTKPLLFTDRDVAHLQQKLRVGTLSKLRTRANKQAADSTKIPAEYAKNPEFFLSVQAIKDLKQSADLDLSALLFFAVLKYLVLREEVACKSFGSNDVFENCYDWRRTAVQHEMSQWRQLLGEITCLDSYAQVFSVFQQAESTEDVLGFLYQSLLNIGTKSKRGAYFTAESLVEDALVNTLQCQQRFLDPCCGTGQYLRYAAKSLSPEHIYGIDIDPLSVRIARLNLLLAFPSQNFTPQVWCADTLSEFATGEVHCQSNDFIGQFDVIATNPPWGAYKHAAIPKVLKDIAKTGESFSLFLIKSLMLLRSGGRLSLILPESILRIKTHADIRAWILQHTCITRISQLGRQFNGVFTPVIRLDMLKQLPPANWQIEVAGVNQTIQLPQSRFLGNSYYTFDIGINADTEEMLQRLYAIPHQTLRHHAQWALGIVTGNNEKYISNNQQDEMEPVIKGRDVSAFKLGMPKQFIQFQPENFQQVASTSLFRAPEKLIYRFISKALVFAYDDHQTLTLNSANILIPKLPNLSIKVTLAFLNSTVFQYIFKHRFATHKVLRGDLETLPFPLITQSVHDEIERLTEAVLSGFLPKHILDDRIFSAFRLTANDAAQIQSSLES